MLDATKNIPIKSAYQQVKAAALPNDDEKILAKTCKLALIAYEDLILSVASNTKAGQVAFDLVS